jgi:hypothetical protein
MSFAKLSAIGASSSYSSQSQLGVLAWSGIESSCPVQLSALLTEAFELGFLGNRGVATLRADKPTFWAGQHRSVVINQNAVRAAYDVLSHFERLVSSLSLPNGPELPCRRSPSAAQVLTFSV